MDVLWRLPKDGSVNSVDDLHAIIQSNPRLLDGYSSRQFINTPLHEAVANNQMAIAMELYRVKPYLAKKENEQGLLPIHVALKNDDCRIFYRFLEENTSMVRFRGKGGKTALHLACELGKTEPIGRLLSLAPDAILDRTGGGDNVLHIAAKRGEHIFLKFILERVVAALYERIDGPELLTTIFNQQNEEGYTVTHVIVACRKDNKKEIKTRLQEDIESSGELQSKKGIPSEDDQVSMLETLITYGRPYLDLQLKSVNGVTAVGLATRINEPDLAMWLSKFNNKSGRFSTWVQKLKEQTATIDGESKSRLQTYFSASTTLSFTLLSYLVIYMKFPKFKHQESAIFLWCLSTIIFFTSLMAMLLLCPPRKHLTNVSAFLSALFGGAYVGTAFLVADNNAWKSAAAIAMLATLCFSGRPSSPFSLFLLSLLAVAKPFSLTVPYSNSMARHC